ncbi:nucleoid occlusion protein [Paenibacillus thermoaerophilus]|uniref:Nucleoid occlusion protein n=1 Tax=Paenibacillus thermoaerophilus TaxID=1215385 RepID=A0ABW2V1N5_9BACL|nr:nucleoid occlusion protein [Paenibacillus thermoaerophilus]TMV06684.1 nucleoid occlusion protein [Paenibacillus thermoaerophilus]
MKEQLSKLFGFSSDKTPTDEVRQLPVGEIIPSPYQPRTVFDDERIDELCQTIKTHGVIQPIVVRVRNQQYELIAGERRLRAVKKLGLETIPAIIREFNDSQAASIALIENLQREGLTSIEEAVAYQQLMEMHNLTQESLAQRLGKSQSTIANKIRLLQLPDKVKQALMDRKVTERHARALLAIDSAEIQEKVLDEIIAKELSVKQTESRIELYKQLRGAAKEKKGKRLTLSKDIRIAINTIRQSIDMVASSGMPIKLDEQNHEDHYEFVIRIPKR